MANINLYQSIQREETFHKKKSLTDKGVVLALAVIIITLLSYGGIKFYTSVQSKQILELEDQIRAEAEKIDAAELNRVADFQTRIENVSDSIDAKKDPIALLSKVEGSMIQGIVLTAYDWDEEKKILAVEGLADSFSTMARQILNLKQIPLVSDVSVKKTSRDKEGKVEFALEANLTN